MNYLQIMLLIALSASTVQGLEEWTPSAQMISNAFVLSEHYCRYVLCDQLKMDKDSIEVSLSDNPTNKVLSLSYSDFPPDLADWTVFGQEYTNFNRRCRAFVVRLGDTPVKFIAVQHVLRNSETNSSTGNEHGFTLYFNTRTGKIGQSLDLPVIIYSPYPPFHLSIHDPKGIVM